MKPSGIIDNMGNMAGNFAPKDDRMEKAMENFAKELGDITKEAASSVVRLVESFSDSEDALQQYQDQLQRCINAISEMEDKVNLLNDNIVDITNAIGQLSDEASEFKSELTTLGGELNDLVSNGASQNVIDAKQQEIAAKESQIAAKEAEILAKQKELAKATSKRDIATQDLRSGKDKRDRLSDALSYERGKQARLSEKVQGMTGRDMSEAKAALQRRDTAISSAPKGGGKMTSMANGLKGLKANPWMMAIDGLVKAIEFGIGKATEYARVNAENALRMMNATFTTEMNTMRANLASWDDSLMGAYSSQEIAIQNQLEMMQATNAVSLASTKLANTWTNWIPIWGEINKYQETAMEMEQKIAETRIANAMKEIALAQEHVKKTDAYLRKQDNVIHTFQRDNGMSKVQTKVFEEYMLKTGVVLSEYNQTVEDALKMQSQFFETTGRTVNYTQDDYVQNAAVGRLVGSDNLANFQSQMTLFNHSVSDSADIMYQMYKDVNKMGLSQKKVTKDVLANLKLANKYDFKNGTKGFIELAKWAENARFNLSTLGGSVEKVQAGGLEGVITQAAKLQVLGGNFAMAANPMAMAFEANADPKAYAERIKNSFSGLGILDHTTGETTFGITDNQRIRAAAEAWGMSVEDAKNIIREDNKKQVVRRQMGGSRLKPDQQDAVINKAQRNETTGRWEVNMLDGTKMDVSQVTDADISNIISDNMDEAAVQYAKNTLSVVEKIEATTKAISSKLGVATFDNFEETATRSVGELLEAFQSKEDEFIKTVKALREDALKEQTEQLKKWGDLYEDFTVALHLRDTGGEEYAETKAAHSAEKLRREGIERLQNDEVESLKSTPAARARLSTEQQEALYNTDTRSFWQKIGDWFAGAGGNGNVKSGTWVSSESDTEAVKAAEAARVRANQDNLQSMQITWRTMKDGVVSSDGSPMYTMASNVTPIQDGVVAKSDPNDTAIFAKSGGPFDILFNHVFSRINDVYNTLMEKEGSIIPKPIIPTEVQPASISALSTIIDNAKNATPNTCHVTFDRPLELTGSLTITDGIGNQINLIQELERNPSLMRQLTQMISESISRNISGGKSAYNGGQLVGGLGFS